MELNSAIEKYESQAYEARQLNAGKKTPDTFYIVAPVDDGNRCEFIEALVNVQHREKFIYRIKGPTDETAVYHVRTVYYGHGSNMIFTRIVVEHLW